MSAAQIACLMASCFSFLASGYKEKDGDSLCCPIFFIAGICLQVAAHV